MINNLVRYFQQDGTPTTEGIKTFQDMERRLAAAEARLAAIAAVTSPTGGATQDAEARTAIDDIITGAS